MLMASNTVSLEQYTPAARVGTADDHDNGVVHVLQAFLN